MSQFIEGLLVQAHEIAEKTPLLDVLYCPEGGGVEDMMVCLHKVRNLDPFFQDCRVTILEAIIDEFECRLEETKEQLGLPSWGEKE
jgi:hypothetical protein